MPKANVIINEVMYNPEGDDDKREYVELLNLENFTVNLSGWVLSDGGKDDDVLQGFGGGSTILSAEGYGLVTDEDTELNPPKDAVHLSCGDKSIASYGLANTGEKLLLYDELGRLVDSLEYDPGWGGNGDGKSLERVFPWEIHWVESSEEGGTPGEVNNPLIDRDNPVTYIRRCKDKTRYGRCSETQPLYCKNGELVEDCGECGCPQGLVCTGEACGNASTTSTTTVYAEEEVAELTSTSTTTVEQFKVAWTSTSLNFKAAEETTTLEGGSEEGLSILTGNAVSNPSRPGGRGNTLAALFVTLAATTIVHKKMR